MSFNKIRKVVLSLILFFIIFKTVNYFYIKTEYIKYYFIEQEVKKISDEYNKIISDIFAKWKNNLAFLEEDNIKTHQELTEIKEAMKSIMNLMQKGLT